MRLPVRRQCTPLHPCSPSIDPLLPSTLPIWLFQVRGASKSAINKKRRLLKTRLQRYKKALSKKHYYLQKRWDASNHNLVTTPPLPPCPSDTDSHHRSHPAWLRTARGEKELGGAEPAAAQVGVARLAARVSRATAPARAAPGLYATY